MLLYNIEIESTLNQFPFLAALTFNNDEQFCGGTIIDSKHILTAAHCVEILSSPNQTKLKKNWGGRSKI